VWLESARILFLIFTFFSSRSCINRPVMQPSSFYWPAYCIIPSLIMPPPLIGRGIKWCFCLTSVCLTSVAYIGPKSRTDRPRKTKNWHRGSPRHTWLGHHFQGQGHQTTLLTAALTREAGAAVTVRTYWAWETTATLRLLGGARCP